MLRMSGLLAYRRCGLDSGFGRFIGGEREEHVLETQLHRPELEQPPSAIDDGRGELAADVAATFMVDMNVDETLAHWRRRHARQPRDGRQPRFDLGGRRGDLQVD